LPKSIGNSSRLKLTKILSGCFLVIAVFLAEAMTRGWCQAAQPAQAIEETKSSTSGSEENKKDTKETWRAWFTKDAAGTFTIGLFIVAIGQAILFFVQLKYMKDGLGDSSNAAKAATEDEMVVTVIPARPGTIVLIWIYNDRPGFR
jgi:uncharacterized membrane protein